jgi:hypothetical protein
MDCCTAARRRPPNISTRTLPSAIAFGTPYLKSTTLAEEHVRKLQDLRITELARPFPTNIFS